MVLQAVAAAGRLGGQVSRALVALQEVQANRKAADALRKAGATEAADALVRECTFLEKRIIEGLAKALKARARARRTQRKRNADGKFT